ncbi:unnamed protein product, partial [Rotaria sp. Silwood1]
ILKQEQRKEAMPGQYDIPQKFKISNLEFTL